MEYLVLIHADERVFADIPKEESEHIYELYSTYHKALDEAGVLRAGAELQPSATARTIVVRDGDRLVTDGPFAESREQIAGYYLIDCANLDEALDWAARCPGASHGTVEVRPVMPT